MTEERCYCAAHTHNGHPVDSDTDLDAAQGETGLRDRLRYILRNVATYHDVGKMSEAIADALAANPAPAGLDVERLAEAIKAFNANPLTAYLVDITYRKQARAIAAEYARLASAAEETP